MKSRSAFQAVLWHELGVGRFDGFNALIARLVLLLCWLWLSYSMAMAALLDWVPETVNIFALVVWFALACWLATGVQAPALTQQTSFSPLEFLFTRAISRTLTFRAKVLAMTLLLSGPTAISLIVLLLHPLAAGRLPVANDYHLRVEVWDMQPVERNPALPRRMPSTSYPSLWRGSAHYAVRTEPAALLRAPSEHPGWIGRLARAVPGCEWVKLDAPKSPELAVLLVPFNMPRAAVWLMLTLFALQGFIMVGIAQLARWLRRPGHQWLMAAPVILFVAAFVSVARTARVNLFAESCLLAAAHPWLSLLAVGAFVFMAFRFCERRFAEQEVL